MQQMYKTLVIFFLTALCFIEVNAQSVYDYSFKDKELKLNNNVKPRPFKFKVGNDIQIRIKDFNPLKHEIIIEDSSMSYGIGDTATLARLVVVPKIPAGSGVQAVDGSSPVTSCSPATALITNQTAYRESLAQVVLDYKLLLSAIETISADYNHLKNLPTLNAEIVKNRVNTGSLTNVNRWEQTNVEEANRLAVDILRTNSNQLRALEQIQFEKITDIEDQLAELAKDFDRLTLTGCTNFVELFKQFTKGQQQAISDINKLKENRVDKILPALSKNLALYDQLAAISTSEPVYTTRAITVTGDLHTISIYSREPGASTKTLHDYINITPNKGFKLNVSGGVFVSGIHDMSFARKTKDSIYTSEYLVNGQLRDTTKQGSFASLYEKQQAKISYGGMLYLHALSQTGTGFNYGGFIGFGALFNDQTRWAGAVGGTLALGKKQRLNINVGALIAQVDRLATPYQTGVWYNETLDNIPTYKAWKIQWMTGFSWSFK